MHLQHSTSVCLPSPAAVLLHRAEPHAQHLPVVQVTAPQWPGLRTSPLAVGYIFNGSNGWLKASAPTRMGNSPPPAPSLTQQHCVGTNTARLPARRAAPWLHSQCSAALSWCASPALWSQQRHAVLQAWGKVVGKLPGGAG